MSRRLFLLLCLCLPALRTAAARPPRAIDSTGDDLVIVDGWILRKVDLPGQRHDR